MVMGWRYNYNDLLFCSPNCGMQAHEKKGNGVMAAMFCLELASQLEVRNINAVLSTLCDSIYYIYTLYYTVHVSLCPCMYMCVCAYVAL